MESICIKCQILFYNFIEKKIQKNIICLSSAEFAQSIESVNSLITTTADDALKYFFLIFYEENKTWHFMRIVS